MGSQLRVAVWVVLAALAFPIGVSAQTASPDDELSAVRELVLHATYRDALTRATAYLARTDLDARHRTSGLEVRAIVQLALRDEAGARQTLADLYARDPGHRLEDPDASPVVQSAFARARDAATPLAATLTDHTDAAPAVRGTPEVSVTIGEHADAVQELRVSYRRAGESRWLAVVVAPDESASATSPLAVSGVGASAYELEYRVEALTPSSTVIGQLGTAEAPLRMAVPAEVVAATALPDDEHPVASSSGGGVETEAWFWVVMSVLIVGAGVGIGVGVAIATTPTADNGSLDTITLPLVSF